MAELSIQPGQQAGLSRTAQPPLAMPERTLRIDLWCNGVAGGWEPGDLETGLGGGEESLVFWTQALAARGHGVRVYRNGHTATGETIQGGVRFLARERFDPFGVRDVLVSWKSPHPWKVAARAPVAIHWSSDVEPPWPEKWLARLKAFVLMSPYHRQALPWLGSNLAKVIPLGVDLEHLDGARVPRIPGRILYASSPDRGLATLLRDWPRIRAAHPGVTLEVCYGWQRFLAVAGGDPAAMAFMGQLENLLEQEGIENRGALSRDQMAKAYWRAEFWALPLNRAQSELFCLNALKAMHCGATGVVNRIGALENTVSRWIDYGEFLQGTTTPRYEPGTQAFSWPRIVTDYWEPLFLGKPCNS